MPGEEIMFFRQVEGENGVNDTTQTPLAGAQWRDTTITVDGPEASTCPGKKLGETGLGYWIAEPEDENDTEPTFYAPTHIASGYRCSAAPFYSEEQCQKYLQELAPLMDWNRPREQLIADPAYSPEKINEINKRHWIEDAAAKAGGGRW
jgi:hypothetical protein